jgi:hypothetical protein
MRMLESGLFKEDRSVNQRIIQFRTITKAAI